MTQPFVTSVADAMPFSPDAPTTLPTSTGYNFLWNPVSKVWEVSDKLTSIRQIWIPDYITTTDNGVFQLEATNHSGQIILGTSFGFTIKLPNALTLDAGRKFDIYNTTPQTIAIKNYSGTLLFTLAQYSIAYLYLAYNTTSTGTWINWQILNTTPTASGIINYTITQSTTFSTNSSTEVPITGFSVVPQTGTYAVWFSADSTIATNNSLHYYSIYKGSTKITDSQRVVQGVGNNFRTSDYTTSVVYFNGLDMCTVYVSVSSGSVSIDQRTLLLVRLGT